MSSHCCFSHFHSFLSNHLVNVYVTFFFYFDFCVVVIRLKQVLHTIICFWTDQNKRIKNCCLSEKHSMEYGTKYITRMFDIKKTLASNRFFKSLNFYTLYWMTNTIRVKRVRETQKNKANSIENAFFIPMTHKIKMTSSRYMDYKIS